MRKERTSVRFIYSNHGHKPVRVVLIIPQEFLAFKFQAPHFAGRCCYDFWGFSFMLFAIGDHFSIVPLGFLYHFFYKFMFIHLFNPRFLACLLMRLIMLFLIIFIFSFQNHYFLKRFDDKVLLMMGYRNFLLF